MLGAWWSISGYHWTSQSIGGQLDRWRISYLGADIVKRRRADDGKANEKDVGLGVGQRAKTLVILLTGGIPETQADGLAIDHDAGRVVVEARGALTSGDEEARDACGRERAARTLSGCIRRERHSWCRR